MKIATAFALIIVALVLPAPHDARPSTRNPFKEVMFRETRDRNENTVSESSNTAVLKLRVTPPSRLSLTVGSSRVLECEAGGNPLPTIHWLKNGKRIVQSVDDALSLEEEENPIGTLGLGFTRSRLFIDCFQPQDEGSYTCVAENSFERLSASSEVLTASSSESLIESNEVALCASKVKKSEGFGSPARINMWTKTRLELIGSEVKLYCRAQGLPKPSITWLTPDNRPVVSGGRFRVTEFGDLIIRDINWQDMGGYQCVAKNQDGEDQSTTFLYPMMPENS